MRISLDRGFGNVARRCPDLWRVFNTVPAQAGAVRTYTWIACGRSCTSLVDARRTKRYIAIPRL